MARLVHYVLVGVGLSIGCGSSSSDPAPDSGMPSGHDAATDAGPPDAASDAGGEPVDASSPPARGDVAHGGSRLQATWDAPLDGEPAFLGFYDTQKKIRCSFKPGADGTLRCLPDEPAASVYYDDEECQTPRLWWDHAPACGAGEGEDAGTPEVDPPPFVTAIATLACPVAYAVRGVGAYLDDGVGQEQRRLTASGLCHGSVSDASYLARYALGAEDDLGDWLEGHAETVSVANSRIEVHFVRGEDGSYVRVGQRDKELDTLCTPAPMGAAGVLCVPETGSFVSDAYAADSECTELVAANETACDPGGDFAFGSTKDAAECPLRSYFERGEKLESVYSTFACELADISQSSAIFHRLGAPVAADAFVALGDARPTSPRLVRELFKDEHGQHVAPETTQRWYDNELHVTCEKQHTVDGEARCVPGRFAEVLYADAACDEPVVRAEPCDDSAHVWTTDHENLGACPARQRVYAIGGVASLTGPLYYRIGPDCEASGAPVSGEYRELSELPSAQLAAFAEP